MIPAPELTDGNGVVLKISEEKGSAPHQRFVQQSDQNNRDERRAVWKRLDRTLTEAGLNDDLITELAFTEALPGSGRETAPGPDKIKYSDIRNLSDKRASSSDCTKKAFAAGQVPENWSHSYIEPVPRLGKDHSKLDGYRILTTQNTTGNLMERIVARTGKERRTFVKPRRVQNRNSHLGKRSQHRIRCLRRIPEEGTHSGRGDRSGRCVQQSAIQTVCTILRHLGAYKMARSSSPGQKSCHATWKLDLHAQTTGSGASTRPSPVPCPLQCLNSNGLSRVLTLANGGLI